MFVFGHLGIGTWATLALARRLGAASAQAIGSVHLRWLLLGTVLPDLIDKPLYYGIVAWTGRRAEAAGFICSTRTIGHTALLALVLWLLLARTRRAAQGQALFVGMASHWFLDVVGGPAQWALVQLGLLPELVSRGPSIFAAILFPLLGFQFPVDPFRSIDEHAGRYANPWTVATELAGLVLLARLWRAGRLGGFRLRAPG